MEKLFALAGKTVFGGLLLLFVSAPVGLCVAWPTMLALGCLHSEVSHHVPALGYWATFLILWGVGSALRYLHPHQVRST